MFGTSILSLVKYAIVATLAIVLSSELLSSAAGAVFALRYGNPVPVITAIVVMLVLMRLSGFRARGDRDSRARIMGLLLSVAAYCSLIYVFVVVFLGLLPFGVPAALIAASMTVAAGRLVQDPRLLTTSMNSAMSVADRLGIILPTDMNRNDARLLMNALDTGRLRVFNMSAGSFQAAVAVLRDRPRLPASITHLECGDFLVLSNCVTRESVAGVMAVFESAGVQLNAAPRLLQEAVLSLPLLEDQHGLPIEEYVFTNNADTTQRVISLLPSRMTVFPSAHTGNLCVITRAESTVGLDMQKIPRHLLTTIVIGRDYRSLEGSDTIVE